MRLFRLAVVSCVSVGSLLCLNLLAQEGGGPPTSCTQYNGTYGPFQSTPTDASEHVVNNGALEGGHHVTFYQTGACSYLGSASITGPVGCDVTATANSTTTAGDICCVTGLRTHYASVKDQNGTATTNNGGTAVAAAEGVGAIESCVGSCVTGIGINISGGGGGGGFNVSFTSQPLWDQEHAYPNTCTGVTLPQESASSCPYPQGQPPYNPENGYMWSWNTTTCTWQEVPNNTPVAIETKKEGHYEFTDPSKGGYVTFDIRGDGSLQRVSWPKVGSGVGWLVLDRDGDGIIKDGTELFGNFTPHSDGGVPNHPSPNGFLALGWYDHPENGGDGNLIIDKRDAVWSKLRLWIDEHCYRDPDRPCESRPEELHTLESEGIRSLSIVYTGSFKTETAGNLFKFAAVVNPAADNDTPEQAHEFALHGRDRNQVSSDGRVMYDVVLKTLP